jgi:hypothetical protein
MAGGAKRSVDLVRRHVVKASPLRFVRIFSKPVDTTSFKQVEGSNDVGVNEISRASDGPIHVRLGCEVHYMSDRMLFDNAHHARFVAQIDLLKNVLWVFGCAFEVCKVPRVSQTVQIDKLLDFRAPNDVMNEI